MKSKNIDVTGIGNAIVDIISVVDDELIIFNGLEKGSMRLIDEETAQKLFLSLERTEISSGGSAANTIAGLANLGSKTAFIGKVRKDDFGNSFDEGLRCIGVKCISNMAIGDNSTARCIVLVTPDAQRTMCTHLGIAGALSPEDIDDETISSSKIIYIEGYLWDKPEAKNAIKKALNICKLNSCLAALTLSDSFCVNRHRDEFLGLINNDLDILFANENEINALFESNDLRLCIEKCKETGIVCAITRSEKDAIIIKGSEVLYVPVFKPEKLVDTTGAGDLFAAGFLYGYINNRSLYDCARIGNAAASETISHFGARPVDSLTLCLKDKKLI